MKFKLLIRVILILTTLKALVGSATPVACLSYYSYKTKYLGFSESFSKALTLSSQRKMQVYFEKGFKFESQKKLYVILHGLGKSAADLKYLQSAAQKRGDSVFIIDLHGFGETAKLNNHYLGSSSIPYTHNRDDVLEILTSLDPQVKIVLVGHSYGGGISLSILEKMKQNKLQHNIQKVILLSPFIKNLDKYFQDALLTDKNILVLIDFLSPYLKLAGVPHYLLESMDFWSNFLLFPSNSLTQFTRDSVYSWIPHLEPFRNALSLIPNYYANMTIAPFHIMANSEISEIQRWQQNPFEFSQLLLNNIAVINGNRDLNFLDYSKQLTFPKGIKYKIIHAQNDATNPNTITQEFQTRMQFNGYSTSTLILPHEDHYYLYGEDISQYYDLIFN